MAGNQNPFFTMFGMDDPFGAGEESQQATPHVEFNATEDFRQLKDKFASMSKKALVAFVIVAVIALAVAYWWFHPPVNIHSVDTWMFVAVFILLPTFLFFRAKSRAYKTEPPRCRAAPVRRKPSRCSLLSPWSFSRWCS